MQFGRSYEEFEVGATYKHWPGKTVTEFDDHLFCLLTMNHHPLHLDTHYAEETTQFGKNVVVGNYVYSILLGMSVPDISGKAIANLEIESLRHVAPTFHGDTLYGETTVLDKWESKSKDDRGVVHVETIGYNQDGKVVCIFRRKVMVPKDSYLEARGGEQPGRPVPQPDKNWPGRYGAELNVFASGRMTSTSTIGTANPTRSEFGADQAGEHRAEQRADVVELVEPADHHVDPGLPDRRRDLRAAGDPGGRGEAQRRDHRDPDAEQGEADDRHLPGGREDDHEQGRRGDHGADPEHRHRRRTARPGRRRPAASPAWRRGRGTSPARPAGPASGTCCRGTSVPRWSPRCRPCRRAPSPGRPARSAATAPPRRRCRARRPAAGTGAERAPQRAPRRAPAASQAGRGRPA